MRPSVQPTPAPLLRTFVAIELPAAVKQQVQERQRQLRQALDREQLGSMWRWTHSDNLHLTLRFLGDTAEEQRVHMETALSATATLLPIFQLSVQKPGVFPNLCKPTIVWLDFRGDLQVLGHLQAQIERAAQAAGFDAEKRAFTPHLTIARAQKSAAPSALARAGELLAMPDTVASPASAAFTVEQIHLIRSDLRPSGPVYHSLRSFRLAAEKM